MAAVEKAQQGGKGRLRLDGNAARAQPQKDAHPVAHMGADVENKRASTDELAVELQVTAGAAGLSIVDKERAGKAPQRARGGQAVSLWGGIPELSECEL